MPQSQTGSNVLMTAIDKFLNWSRMNSLWPLEFGLACCAIEFMSTAGPRFDQERFGMAPRSTPRQADLMIVSGTVTFKMGSRLKTLYEQMAEPKYAISMGSCANCGGPYWNHGYHVMKGVDNVIPVDVYVPGCPPRPEALIDGIITLREQIRYESTADRGLDETALESKAPV